MDRHDPARESTDEEGEEQYSWDIFTLDPAEDDDRADYNKYVLYALRVAKILFSVLLFGTVLCGAVVSKGSVLFMTSQLRAKKTVRYCDSQLPDAQSDTYLAVLPDVERIAWVWMLLFALYVPEAATLCKSAYIMLRSSVWGWPTLLDFATVLTFETLSSIGLSMLVFSVLPDLDSLEGLMLTNCVCLLPAIFNLLETAYPNKAVLKRQEAEQSSPSNDNSTLCQRKYFKHIAGFLAIAAQLTGFILWPIVENTSSVWITPLAILLISLSWWENYTNHYSRLGFMKMLATVKTKLAISKRYPTYLFISLWKMLVYFLCMISIWAAREENVSDLFDKFHESFQEHSIPVHKSYTITDNVPSNVISTNVKNIMVVSVNSAPWVLLIQISASFICYTTGKMACRIMVQGFSYATPVCLSVPVTLSILISFCGLRFENPCHFEDSIPGYLFFNTPDVYSHFFLKQFAWLWFAWLGSQIYITYHIWTPKCERLAATEQLFVCPMYNTVLIDQSLALNRRIDDEPQKKRANKKTKKKRKEKEDDPQTPPEFPFEDAATPRIIACATMWHETREEMEQMIKSVIRMDNDQGARRLMRKTFMNEFQSLDYYEFETHVFFDDAFETNFHDGGESVTINSYVKDLIKTVEDAGVSEPPSMLVTPYGGQLVWKLTGGTQMIVHLKDSAKIRHKKRWSQVMYMYYLLGYCIQQEVEEERKNLIAENTYLLALDGDIDFQPGAVLRLVDLMKRDRNLGAACGRIHPVGSGPMVWYQKFEYAIGHWLQKSTEHVIGCVLCSPGCFSLFRASALMETNVMKKYTTQSTLARHYVQFDQGEDRWLCTLLLQKGFRIEYCAASDAYTHCPEGFVEFYNQRRRWVPSTMANIMDLLSNQRRTVSVNENISFLYIIYQVILLGGSILGPGTILLMLVGACSSVFNWSNQTSLIINVTPVIVFMLVCYFTSSKTQTAFAMIYTIVYCILMLAVLVGILVQISEDGILAPTSLFFILVSGQFIIAAVLHPLEIGCLPYGIIYYVTVPSMYMLLIIYSLFNLNNVSWGTRETIVPQAPQQPISEASDLQHQIPLNKKEKGIKKIIKAIRTEPTKQEKGSFELAFTNLFKCMFCIYEKPLEDDGITLADIVEEVKLTLDIDKEIKNTRNVESMRAKAATSRSRTTSLGTVYEASDVESTYSDCYSTSTVLIADYQLDQETHWMYDPALKHCNAEFISGEEELFWKQFISKYVKPLEKNTDKQKRVAKELKTLRDRSVLGFFLLNAMFVTLLVLMQMNKSVELLNIKWPLRDKNKSILEYDSVTSEIKVTTQQLILEPIGLMFLISFGVVIVIQFVAMLFHRLDTFLHLLSTTKIPFLTEGSTHLEEMHREAAEKLHDLVVQEMRQSAPLKLNVEEPEESDIGSRLVPRRHTFTEHQQLHEMSKKRTSHDDAFITAVENIRKRGIKLPDTVHFLINKNSPFFQAMKKRNSVVFTEPESHTLSIENGNSDGEETLA